MAVVSPKTLPTKPDKSRCARRFEGARLEALGVIITAVSPEGHKGFVTVSEAKRSFELGLSMVRQHKHYYGRYWQKELYEEAVATLQEAIVLPLDGRIAVQSDAGHYAVLTK